MTPDTQIAREAAEQIVPWTVADEGTGTLEEMKEGYGHNEWHMQERERVADIILAAINRAREGAEINARLCDIHNRTAAILIPLVSAHIVDLVTKPLRELIAETDATPSAPTAEKENEG